MPAVCLLRVAVPMITAASVTILVIFAVVMCMDRLARYGRNRERRHWQFFHTEPQSFDFLSYIASSEAAFQIASQRQRFARKIDLHVRQPIHSGKGLLDFADAARAIHALHTEAQLLPSLVLVLRYFPCHIYLQVL